MPTQRELENVLLFHSSIHKGCKRFLNYNQWANESVLGPSYILTSCCEAICIKLNFNPNLHVEFILSSTQLELNFSNFFKRKKLCCPKVFQLTSKIFPNSSILNMCWTFSIFIVLSVLYVYVYNYRNHTITNITFSNNRELGI